MTRAERAAFIKGLEAARRISLKCFARWKDLTLDPAGYRVAVRNGAVARFIADRIRRERKKARAE